MKTYFLSISLILIVGTLAMSCTQQKENQDETVRVKATVDNFARFWETEDTLLLNESFDSTSKLISYGADKDEVFKGYQAFKTSIVQMLPMFDQTKVAIRDQQIEVSPLGDAAWFSEVMDWKLLLDKKPTVLANQRVTGVLLKKNNKWVIVSFHVSIPIAPH